MRAALAASLEGCAAVNAVVLRGSQVLAPQDDGDPLSHAVVMGPRFRGDDD